MPEQQKKGHENGNADGNWSMRHALPLQEQLEDDSTYMFLDALFIKRYLYIYTSGPNTLTHPITGLTGNGSSNPFK